jgi:hypothetical protein
LAPWPLADFFDCLIHLLVTDLDFLLLANNRRSRDILVKDEIFDYLLLFSALNVVANSYFFTSQNFVQSQNREGEHEILRHLTSLQSFLLSLLSISRGISSAIT